jgi:hypothetical protein
LRKSLAWDRAFFTEQGILSFHFFINELWKLKLD